MKWFQKQPIYVPLLIIAIVGGIAFYFAIQRDGRVRECIATCKAKYEVPDGYSYREGACYCATAKGWERHALPGEQGQ